MKTLQAFKVLKTTTAIGLLCFGMATTASAQAWPNKQITFVVPFTAGSATDIMARVISEKLGPRLGQTVVVDNKVGAGGTIGTAAVAKAAPDGYTFVIVSTGHVVNPVLYSKLNYQLKDLAGVSPLGSLPSALVAAPGLGVKTVKELVDKNRAAPNGLNYASAGVGSAAHVNAEKFVVGLKLKGNHIPYKGSAGARTDVLSGQVDMMFDAVTTMSENIKANKVKGIATTGRARSNVLPDMPTMNEAGVPQYDAVIWLGLMAPAGTPEAIVSKLNAEINKIVNSADVKATWSKQGAVPMSMTVPVFTKFVADDVAKWANIVKVSGAKPD
ncbi:MAG: tripartite tricarboxylate transporter substrate binding protein [Betaproteobacteria bacterium]|nr:tripartite tricarboxylate transporter substrate binding protein [Betaproteobacteria bacterium]